MVHIYCSSGSSGNTRDLLFRLVQKYSRNWSGSFFIRRGWHGFRKVRFRHEPKSSMMPLLNPDLMTSLLLHLKLNVKGEFTFQAKTRQQGPFPISPRIYYHVRTFKWRWLSCIWDFHPKMNGRSYLRIVKRLITPQRTGGSWLGPGSDDWRKGCWS